MELEVAGKEAKDLKATSEQALVARGIGGNKTLLARTEENPGAVSAHNSAAYWQNVSPH